ncbi:family A G protein-coupled receptor-like protein [Hypoxylon sp. EC38]|nr:family A G protein-coupled receptor-like protein [Hypoxylon sp. EC38]
MSGPGNQALNINSVVAQHANLEITNHGSDWYYAVCALMGACTILFMALSFMKPQEDRIFHYITAGITGVACIAYFAMGSNLGQTPIQAEFVRPSSRWRFFYARYIDWVITTPLLLLDLLLTAGVPTPAILTTLLADEIMIVGILDFFGTAALFFIAYELLFDARRHAQTLGGDAKKTFMLCGVFLILIWFLYPIAWGLSEGGNLYLAKPVFGLLLIWGHRKISSSQLGLRIRNRSLAASEKYNPGPRSVQSEGPDKPTCK